MICVGEWEFYYGQRDVEDWVQRDVKCFFGYCDVFLNFVFGNKRLLGGDF